MAAEDRDNDPLTYGISGPNAYFFKVTPATGEVRLDSLLDYEVKGGGRGRSGRGWETREPWEPVLGAGACLVRAHRAPLSSHCRRSPGSQSSSL